MILHLHLLPHPLPTNNLPQTQQILPVRKSNRVSTKPKWVSDFTATVCQENKASSSHPEDIDVPEYQINIPSLDNSYTKFLANVSIIKEPKLYNEAKEDSNWVRATQISTLELNNT